MACEAASAAENDAVELNRRMLVVVICFWNVSRRANNCKSIIGEEKSFTNQEDRAKSYKRRVCTKVGSTR
eukprot:scaffold191602_cov23-Cyclotella_meneghiniana.AAC.1